MTEPATNEGNQIWASSLFKNCGTARHVLSRQYNYSEYTKLPQIHGDHGAWFDRPANPGQSAPFSRSSSWGRSYISATVFTRNYFIIQTQRTTAVIKALGAISVALVSRDLYYPGAKHLLPILELLLPGIDLVSDAWWRMCVRKLTTCPERPPKDGMW